MSAVYCRGLCKTYYSSDDAIPALRGIDLDVASGELMMLVGPSGCGKTTLISVIAGILDHDAGECRVFDTDLQHLSNQAKLAFRAQHIGFVFQAFNLLPTLSIAENVAIPLIINGVARKRAEHRALEMLARVGLAERARAMPAQLSGGQQQRVAIARALVHGPRLIVCDEPTSALDHDTGQKIMALFKEVALDAERALLIVTHDARIFGFADRIAHMDDGRIERIEISGAFQ